jgi:phage N-6-adenine-methyltransferase
MNGEWYTPAKYVELARAVLRNIDLDPASSPIAQETVGAATYFTAETNGLDREWHGKVWMNPPHSRKLIAPFVDKLIDEYTAGRTTEAIVLTHNSTDTRWFHKLAETADRICFKRGRVRFVSPEGKLASPTQGQAFTYFGDNPDRFTEVFREVGFVLGRIDMPANDNVRVPVMRDLVA